MKCINIAVWMALTGVAWTVLAQNGTTPPPAPTANQPQQASSVNAPVPNASVTPATPTAPAAPTVPSAPAQPEGMTTQMTEEDKVLREAVRKTLESGGFVGVRATVSAGAVTLEGTVLEDQLQALVDAVSKVNKGNPPNIDALITSKVVPHSATPAPAATPVPTATTSEPNAGTTAPNPAPVATPSAP